MGVDRLPHGVAGIIDEDVKSSDLVEHRSDQIVEVLLAAEVGADHQGSGADGGHFCRSLAERAGRARPGVDRSGREHEAGAPRREPKRYLLADPPAGAGDEDDPSVE